VEGCKPKYTGARTQARQPHQNDTGFTGSGIKHTER